MLDAAASLLADPARQRHSLTRTEHRPYPLPRGPWVMGQSWRHLLFAHWPVPDELLRPLVPAPLSLDRFEGTAWVGVTPFRVTALHPRLGPALPIASRFLEANVRTYVTLDDRPGILFFTLDAGRLAAVVAARIGYRLPYRPARMRLERRGGRFEFRSRRPPGLPSLEIEADYGPDGPVFQAGAGSREHFLAERYCLYTVTAGSVLRTDIHHPPWPLQAARGRLRVRGDAPVEGEAPLLHFADRQDVLVWAPRPVARTP